MIFKVVFLTLILLFATTTSASAMTKADLTERILRKTGISQEEFRDYKIKRLDEEAPNACTPPQSVVNDLQGIVVLCLGANANSGSHASKPKEIVVVGSKVFVVPTDYILEIENRR